MSKYKIKINHFQTSLLKRTASGIEKYRNL